MATKVKAVSNIEDSHFFGLSDEGAAGVGKSQGFGEDSVGWIFSLDHVGAGSLFTAFGRASEKEQSIVIGNARGADQGGTGVGSSGGTGRATENVCRSSHRSAGSAVGGWHD